MTELLSYNPDQDSDIHVTQQIQLGEITLAIEAATTAGRKEPSDAQKPNEDAFATVQIGNSLIAAVFDGASSQKPIPEIEPMTGARFASHTLKDLLETSEAQALPAALSKLNQKLGKKLAELPSVDFTDRNSLPTSTATLVSFNPEKDELEVAHVCDSFAIALHDDNSTSLLTNNLHRAFDEKVLVLITDIAKEKGISHREARKDPRVRPAIMEMFQYERNRPDGQGSGSANGDPNMDLYIDSNRRQLSHIRAVLIGSDGLVAPGLDERKPEDRQKMFAIAFQKGIRGLIAFVRATEDKDPNWNNVRYKHADDATGIFVKITR